MKEHESLIGKTFGRLTVVDEYKRGKHYKSLCQCSCGNQKEVYSDALKHGRTRSCGCYSSECNKERTKRLITKENIQYAHERKTQIAAERMIGKTFGYLTVLRRSVNEWPTDNKYPTWVCKCKCGNIAYVAASNLTRGNTLSCGCKREKDLSGMTFGKLKVIKKIQTSRWLCLCECGTETIVKSSALISGHTSSCGCLRSKNEQTINEILSEYGIEHLSQYTFEDLKAKGKNCLPFDSAILKDGKLIALIEYQGRQHLPSYGKEYGRYQREVTDEAKKQYCKANNIPLFYIWFNEDIRTSINNILSELKMPIPCCDSSVTTISEESTSPVKFRDGSIA